MGFHMVFHMVSTLALACPAEDAPEPEGAKELYDWMRDRGCTGQADRACERNHRWLGSKKEPRKNL